MEKMIKVDEDVHQSCKEKAKTRGMTLKGYIKFLVEKDKIIKGDYRGRYIFS